MDALIKKYDLLPYSQLVWEMEQQMPGVYDTYMLLQFNPKTVDVDCLKKAIQCGITNHPVFKSLGKKYYDISIEIKGDVGFVYTRLNRILGDDKSTEVLVEDIGRAYIGLPLEKDHYEEYMQRFRANQLTKRYAEHRNRMLERYGVVDCPVRPTLDYPLGEDAKWLSGEVVMKIGDRVHPKLSMMQQVCLATTMAIMDYCGTDEAALTWAYLGRDTIEDQRVYGSLHKDVPMRIRRAETIDDYLRQVRNECRQGIACSDYPLTLTPPYTETWNYAVNVLEQTKIYKAFGNFPFSLKPIPIEESKQRLAYSLLDIEIGEGQLVLKYSATHYKKESMEKFAEMVVERMEWLGKIG